MVPVVLSLKLVIKLAKPFNPLPGSCWTKRGHSGDEYFFSHYFVNTNWYWDSFATQTSPSVVLAGLDLQLKSSKRNLPNLLQK